VVNKNTQIQPTAATMATDSVT